MKIERKVNGEMLSFELTPGELYDAYDEQQHKFDVSDVENMFEEYEDDRSFTENFGVSMEEAMPIIEDIAYEMRRLIDKYDVDWNYARDEAARTVIESNFDLHNYSQEDKLRIIRELLGAQHGKQTN